MLPSVYLLVGSKPGLTPGLYLCLFLGSKQGSPRPLFVLVLILIFVHIAIPPLPPSSAACPRLRFPPSSLSTSSQRTDVRTHSRAHGQRLREGETPSFPRKYRDSPTGMEEGTQEERRCTGKEISLVPLPVSVGFVGSGSLSCFLRSSVPLSGCFIRCIGRAWGVTNPSRIRIAAPTVGIRRAIGPDDTRKPNGKRKYDVDFRSMKRIRETPDRAGPFLVSPAHLHALYIHPRCMENESPLFLSFCRLSSITPAASFATPVRSHIRMLETRRLVAGLSPRSHWAISVFLLPLERKTFFHDCLPSLATNREHSQERWSVNALAFVSVFEVRRYGRRQSSSPK